MLFLVLVATVCLVGCDRNAQATVLSKNAMRTNASDASVSSAMHNVYRELRLNHYTNSDGEVLFPDGTSTDRSVKETANVSGSFCHHQMSFETPDRKPVVINFYREDGQDGLIVWEYQGGDPQQVSVCLQVALSKSGVALK